MNMNASKMSEQELEVVVGGGDHAYIINGANGTFELFKCDKNLTPSQLQACLKIVRDGSNMYAVDTINKKLHLGLGELAYNCFDNDKKSLVKGTLSGYTVHES